MAPDISIIMPVYNAMPYLTRALDSLLNQTYDQSKIEIITIDDGSTDESGEILDRYAAEHPSIKVIHQANSGTASAPRNVGLGVAQGEYVFFCDNDDYMGEEAVERLLAHAREWSSDIVLAKLVGVGGRYAPRSMFEGNQPSADLYTSRVTWTLGPWKLFRRSLLDDFNIRFPEDSLHEDITFVLNAYFHSKVISVAADYDYYFYTYRDDGKNITTTSLWKKIGLRVRGMEHAFNLIGEHSDPLRRDEVLMVRIFRDEVGGVLALVPSTPEAEQNDWLRRIRECALPFYTTTVAAGLPFRQRLQMEAMAQDDLVLLREVVADGEAALTKMSVVEDGDSVRLRYTSDSGRTISFQPEDVAAKAVNVEYRITEAEWRDQSLSISGTVTTVIAGAPELRLLCRQFKREQTALVVPVQVDAEAAQGKSKKGLPAEQYEWRASLTAEELGKLAALAKSAGGDEVRWDFYLLVKLQGFEREIRIGSERTDDARLGFFAGSAAIDGMLFMPYQTGFKNVSLHAASDLAHLGAGDFELDWRDAKKARLTLKGKLSGSLGGAKLHVVLRRTDGVALRDGSRPVWTASHACLIPMRLDKSRASAAIAAGKVNGAEPLQSGEWEVMVVAEVGDSLSPLPAKITMPKLRTTHFRRGWHFYRLSLRDSAGTPVLAVRRLF